MTTGAIILAVFFLLAGLNLVQLYLHSVTVFKLRKLTQRLTKLERLLGEEEGQEGAVAWTPVDGGQGVPGHLSGRPAPALALRSVDGTEITPELLAGRPALVLFLSASCVVCRDLFAQLLAYLDAAPPPLGLPSTVIAISDVVLAPDVEEATADEIRVLQVVAPLDHPVRNRYSIKGTPYAVLIDRQGIVVNDGQMMSMAQLLTLARRSPEWNTLMPTISSVTPTLPDDARLSHEAGRHRVLR